MNGLYLPLQADYTDDERVVELSALAELLWVRILAKCKRLKTDGRLHRVHLQSCAHPDMLPDLDMYVAELERVGLIVKGGSWWNIPSWLKHNKSMAEVEAGLDQRREAGKASVAARSQRLVQQSVERSVEHVVQRSVEQKPNEPVSVSVLPVSTAVLHPPARVDVGPVAPGNGSADPPTPLSAADSDASDYEPDDPTYKLDLDWHAEKELAYWQKHLGKIPGGQMVYAQNALERLHTYCKLSLRQVQALVKLCVTDADARGWWGTGKSPATWLDNRTGTEPLWIRIRAHALKVGAYPSGAPAKTIRAPDPGPDPGVDRSCDCRRGWINDQKRGCLDFCRKCARGKWLKAGGRDK